MGWFGFDLNCVWCVLCACFVPLLCCDVVVVVVVLFVFGVWGCVFVCECVVFECVCWCVCVFVCVLCVCL